LFDADWYRKRYPDVDMLGVNPLAHYLKYGFALGRDPEPRFSSVEYLRYNPDVARRKMDALDHFVLYGRAEGRSIYPVERFDGLPAEPRFGGREYGPIDSLVAYDGPARLLGERLSVCVHLHLFHTDLAGVFAGYLRNIPRRFTLLVSAPEDEDPEFWRNWLETELANCNRCVVKRQENRGRDILPMVDTFRREILDHDVLFHCHSKVSSYESAYRDWRTFLLHNTLGSTEVVAALLAQFREDSHLGLVAPPYFHALQDQPQWGANRARVDAMLSSLGMQRSEDPCPDFPAGSFFWARVTAIAPLLTGAFGLGVFEPEGGQIDGTLAHAIERLLGIVPRRLGYEVKFIGVDVGYNLKNYWTQARVDRLLSHTGGSLPRQRLERVKELPEGVRDLRVAVCTCVAGDIDELIPPPIVEKGVDYFCFTDSRIGEVGHYRLLRSPYIDVSPQRTARYVKTHPHILLPGYDVVVWLDANVISLWGVAALIERVRRQGGALGLIAHPIRTSYLDEARECARIGADDAQILLTQANHYLLQGIVEGGLIETNVMVAFMQAPGVLEFYGCWWREICRYSLRDQVSVNCALQESGVDYRLILDAGASVRDHEGFLMFAHGVRGRQAVVDYIMAKEL
jgi:hypothetical protein